MSKEHVITQAKKEKHIFLLLLMGLLFLRFPFLILSRFIEIPLSKDVGTGVYRDGTYLITAMLIILKRDSLSDYNIDFCSLLIFMIAPIARLLSEYLLMKNASLDMVHQGYWLQTVVSDLCFQIAISVCLLIALIYYHPKLRKRSIKDIFLWLLIVVVVGICAGALTGNLLSSQDPEKIPNYPTILLSIRSFILQLGNAAVMEEPLFRGFLWGFLKNIHWKEHWIWLFQASLFMLGHIYFVGVSNYSFFIIVPIMALILGLLVWRSRSIGTSMIAHGLTNSIGDIVAHYTW